MRLPLANSAAECLIAVADVLFAFFFFLIYFYLNDPDRQWPSFLKKSGFVLTKMQDSGLNNLL